jgi:tRNA(Ile)-lysidine synthetase-like protein
MDSTTQLTPSPLVQDRWIQAFVKYGRVKGLFQENQRILLSVSGGLDSSVLAHLSIRAARLLNNHVELVHVDHRTRGMTSEREGIWVKTLGDRLGIKVNLVSLPDRAGVHMAHAELRSERRHLLLKLAEEGSFDHIATAHHADDNAETFLMRAISGTGVNGLAGMSPMDGKWIKPLLWATRKDLEDYARRFRLGWVEDPSNAQSIYLRNRIRHEWVPQLESIRQGAMTNLARAAERLDQEERQWEEWLIPQFEGPVELLSRSFLEKYPECLQRRIFRIWLTRLQLDAEPALVEALLEGNEVVHREGAFLRRSDMYIFSRETEFGREWQAPQPVELGKRISFGSSTAWSFLKGSAGGFHQGQFSVFLLFRPPTKVVTDEKNTSQMSWDRLPWPLLVRGRREEDSSKELDESLARHRVPKPFWKAWPLLVSREDPSKIVALLGVEVLKEYRLTKVGRCVSMECFFEENLRSNSPA